MSEYVFKLPDLGEGTVESEIGEWAVAVGDIVAEEDVVGTMMTDKAAVEISSPVSGKVLRLAGEPGDMIAVGAPLIVFETDADAPQPEAAEPEAAAAPATVDKAADQKPEAPEPPPPAPAPSPPPPSNRKVVTSPAIRRMAKEAGVDLRQVAGSGPGGRILRADYERWLEARSATGPAAAAVPERETTEAKVIGLRRVIAERMTAAKREIPHFAYVEEIDITELEALRTHLNARRERDARLTLLPFLGLALVRALREFPQCNATYDKDRNVIVRHGPIHIGIATQTPDGLKVPVVRHCERLGLDALAAEIRRVSTAARDNSIGRAELTGSTITMTSLGKLGGIASTPVINQPEVAIVGVNRAVLRPMYVGGIVTPRLMMNLSSSFDHRFVDGFDAASMIQSIKEMLEHPATIFAQLGAGQA